MNIFYLWLVSSTDYVAYDKHAAKKQMQHQEVTTNTVTSNTSSPNSNTQCHQWSSNGRDQLVVMNDLT